MNVIGFAQHVIIRFYVTTIFIARSKESLILSMASNGYSSQDGSLLLIFVRFNSQHAFPIEVDRAGLVQSIHDEIAKKHDIAHDDFKIIFQGKNT